MNYTKGLVSIVIPSWNDAEYVEKCLGCIKRQTYTAWELVVVDNNSSDACLEMIRTLFPELTPKIIENKINFGFAKAMNQGISASRGEFVLALNMDVMMDERFIGNMVKAMDLDNIGSASGKLYRFSDESAGKKIIDTTGHVLLANRSMQNRGEGEEDTGQYDDKKDIFGVSGAAALYRREMLEDIKIDGEYFDGYFFALYEDTDLDWRAILRGWKCVFVPEAFAYHRRRSRGWVQNFELRSNVKRNKFLTALKDDHLVNYLVDLPVILAYELDNILYRHFKDYRLFFMEYFKMIAGIPVALMKRAVISRRKKISAMSFRKHIKYETSDIKKVLNLMVLIGVVCLIGRLIGFGYAAIIFFAVFFAINPAIYYLSAWKRDRH